MAEERLIDNDEDKDRKYKIRVNEDGEEELIIIDDGEIEEETENIYDNFEVTESDVDDEEAAVLTPEQLAERERARQIEEERRNKQVEEYLARAQSYFDEGDYDNALYVLSLAEEEKAKSGEVALLKFRVITKNLTDYSRLDDCLECSYLVRDNCTEEQRKLILSEVKPLEKLIAVTRDEADSLNGQNEQKRNERRAVFIERRKTASKYFLITALPFVVLLALAIGFSTVMFSKQDGFYLYLTIGLAAAALIFFIASLFTAHKLWEAQRNIRLNAKNSSTKLGRQYEDAVYRLKALSDIYGALGGK